MALVPSAVTFCFGFAETQHRQIQPVLMEIQEPHSQELDDATANLIIQLQCKDIEELLGASKGKGRDGEKTDADIALATYQQELQTMNTILTDRYMGKSLTRAVISDATLLNESLAEENAAARDRVLAHSMSGVNAPPAAPGQTTVAQDPEDGFLARLAALYVSGYTHDDDVMEDTVHSDAPTAAESSTWAASRQKSSMATYRHCAACGSAKPFSDVCQTPCGHFYCQ